MTGFNRDDYLSADEIATRRGIKRRTWFAYVHRGRAPAPDFQEGQAVLWLKSTIDTYDAARPGKPGRPRKP